MSPSRRRNRSVGRLSGALLSVVAAGCATLPAPGATLGKPDLPLPEVPVVLVPGITGSRLCDRVTGEVVWGDGWDAMFPRDGGYGLALPISGEVRLEPCGIVEEVRLGPVRRGIYRSLIEAMLARGYRRGRLEEPSDGEATLYTFAYDWRQSTVRAAGSLAASLERVRRVRDVEVLQVDLVCQSSGGSVCRFFAKYGGLTLEEAEAGRSALGSGVRVRRVVLVGSSNGGAVRTLRELDRGRRYLAPFGRRLHPEVLFTYRALFEDLPHRAERMLLDHRGDFVAGEWADLLDAATWRRFGWSALGDDASRRLDRGGRTDLFGTCAERLAYLERSLRNARRLHVLLAQDPEGFGADVRYHLVGSGYAETPARAVVVPDGPGWRTLFPGDRALEGRPYLAARAARPGDGHATLESLHHLSPAEERALASEPFYVDGGHLDMIVRPEVHRRILELLLE